MRWRSEFTLYLGAIAIFAGVVLWARGASPVMLAFFGGLFVVLLVAFVWQVARPRRVLVVGGGSQALGALDGTLEDLGYEVRRCAGPTNRPCPVFQGHPCPMTERPVAAIVFRGHDEVGRYAPCGAAFSVPEVIVEEHLGAEPATVGRMTRLGIDEGSDRIIVAMEEMLA